MSFKGTFIIMLSVALAALRINPVIAEITIEPFGFAVSVEENDEAEVELMLTNSDEDEVTFSIEYSLVEEEDDQRAGPHRDDLGDIVATFELPYLRILGYAWDGEYMWGVGYNDNRLICIDPDDFEIIRDYGVNGACVAMTWDSEDEVFWLGVYNNTNVLIYDREGDHIRTINMADRTAGTFSYDGEFFYWYSRDLNQIRKLDRDLRNVGQIGNFRQVAANGQDIRGITWVAEHDEGHFWLQTNERRCIQVDVDFDNNRVNQIAAFNSRGAAHDGIAHDGRNLWTSGQDGEREGVIYDDGIREFDMLTLDPEEGVVPGNDSESVNIAINPEGYEAGVYNILIEIELAEPVETQIEISAVVTVGDAPTFNLTGVVTDADSEEIIEGAAVEMDCYSITRFTNEEGAYAIANLPLGAYEFTFTAPDYLPYIEDINIEEAGDFELDASLFHSECNPNPAVIQSELAPGSETQVSIEISNDGNGPLTYVVERRLPGDANVDPWDLRQSLMVGQDREDPRIQGVVFAGDNFYVTGAHDNEPAIYSFNREGEYIDLFIQPGEDRYGMKDIACDGELIWGAIGSTIYGLTLNGEVQIEFEAQVRSIANTAWDADRQWLWVSGITTNIAALDLEGNQQAEIDRRNLRIYGLAYYPDDPDDHPLYIYTKEPETDRAMLHKANPEDDDIMFITYLDPELGGSPYGTFITNQYDLYSWIFMAVANAGNDEGGDRVDIWHIDARKDWIQIEPVDGVIENGETQEFELTLDAIELPVGIFEAELVYIHDGVGGVTTIPVTLAVVEGPVQAQRTIRLEMGWNMVSVNLQPDPDDIRVLMRELVEADLLLLMKDGQGRFYSPEFDFCNIPGWNAADGYQVKMDDAGELQLAGITVMADDAIPLTEGWNLISYYPRTPVDAIVAFSGIEDRLLMAKDGVGRFYNPEWGFSNMGDLEELRGYQVKVMEDLELVYRLQAEDDDFVMNVRDRQAELPIHPNTGNNMSLLVKSGLVVDGEIGVHVNGELVGSGVLIDGICGIAVWGDDPTTPEIDGALQNQSLNLAIHDEKCYNNVVFKTLAGESVYRTDSFWAVEFEGVAEIPTEFGIISTYPNPFNSRMIVRYALQKANIVVLSVFDLTGRQVMELASGQQEAGVHSVTVDGDVLASGIYFVKLQTIGQVSKWKVVLVR